VTSFERRLPRSGIVLYSRELAPSGHVVELLGDPEGVMGRSAEQIRAISWAALVHADDIDRVAAEVAELSPGEERALHYRVRAADGGSRTVRDTMRRSEEAPETLVGVLWDASREGALRARVAMLEERLGRMHRTDSLGSLAAGVAHDFNNLLTTILSAAQLVGTEEALSEAARSDLELIRDAAESGRRMVSQILRFASRGSRYRGEMVDLGAAIGDLATVLDRTVGGNVSFDLEVEPGLPELQVDPAQVDQIVLNLVVNARDAMPDGGSVAVRMGRMELDEPLQAIGDELRPGEYVVIHVLDTGVGIAEERREAIFDPFVSSKTELEGATGPTGLGLPTVRRIARGYGGAVTVEGREGRGTDFGVWLPVRARRSTALPDVVRPGGGPVTHRVLLVEDDPSARSAVTRALIADGHEVVAVGSVAEAIRVFDRASPRFDLVVSDLLLPDRSGMELVEAVHQRSPGLPVVYISGYGAERVADRTRNPGEVFLPKPFSLREFSEAVTRAMAGARAGRRDDDAGSRRASRG